MDTDARRQQEQEPDASVPGDISVAAAAAAEASHKRQRDDYDDDNKQPPTTKKKPHQQKDASGMDTSDEGSADAAAENPDEEQARRARIEADIAERTASGMFEVCDAHVLDIIVRAVAPGHETIVPGMPFDAQTHASRGALAMLARTCRRFRAAVTAAHDVWARTTLCVGDMPKCPSHIHPYLTRCEHVAIVGVAPTTYMHINRLHTKEVTIALNVARQPSIFRHHAPPPAAAAAPVPAPAPTQQQQQPAEPVLAPAPPASAPAPRPLATSGTLVTAALLCARNIQRININSEGIWFLSRETVNEAVNIVAAHMFCHVPASRVTVELVMRTRDADPVAFDRFVRGVVSGMLPRLVTIALPHTPRVIVDTIPDRTLDRFHMHRLFHHRMTTCIARAPDLRRGILSVVDNMPWVIDGITPTATLAIAQITAGAVAVAPAAHTRVQNVVFTQCTRGECILADADTMRTLQIADSPVCDIAGIAAALHSSRFTTSLRALVLDGCNCGNDDSAAALESLADALRTSPACSELEELRVTQCETRLAKTVLDALLRCPASRLAHLVRLSLDSAGTQLWPLLARCPMLEHLHVGRLASTHPPRINRVLGGPEAHAAPALRSWSIGNAHSASVFAQTLCAVADTRHIRTHQLELVRGVPEIAADGDDLAEAVGVMATHLPALRRVETLYRVSKAESPQLRTVQNNLTSMRAPNPRASPAAPWVAVSRINHIQTDYSLLVAPPLPGSVDRCGAMSLALSVSAFARLRSTLDCIEHTDGAFFG